MEEVDEVELVVQRVAALDLGKATLEACMRVPHSSKPGRRMQEIRGYLSVARGQLDLIENSFQLIADQIVTMQSPTELSGQLDDLLDGVESIRQTAVDTEKFLSATEVS